jgi:hypothetical protein
VLLCLPDPRIDRRKPADKFSARFSLSSVTPPCRALDRHNIEADCDPFLITANSRDDVKGISDDYKPRLS